MEIQEAKETVVLAGKKLVESGLIARTWGNVSCRISDSHFVITPSGRDYISLTPDEIVEVAVSDCSYVGSIKPSSEKGIHAEVYKLHPDANFVIHTHQDYASAISVLMLDSIKVSKDFPSLNSEVICANYSLPGTKKLRRNVAEALVHSTGNAVIMKNHGALCFGKDYENTFEVAQELEKACKCFIQDQYLKISNQSVPDPVQIGCFALTKLTRRAVLINSIKPLLPCESERVENSFMLHFGDETIEIVFDHLDKVPLPNKSLSIEAEIHNEIYKNHKNINNIIHASTPGITAVSWAGIKLLPLLDDFAQIAGTSVRTVEMDSPKISAALKRASAVLLKNNGALCCGISKGDALAVSLVVEKNCTALTSAALFGKVKPINRFECSLMRFVYLKKYSKQANTK